MKIEWSNSTKVGRLGAVALVLLAVCGCSDSGDAPAAASITATERSPVLHSRIDAPSIARDTVAPGADAQMRAREDPLVLIKTSLGEITVKLNVEKAPITVDNFLTNYVLRGHYNGTIFHYVDPEKTVLGGGFTQDMQPKETRAPIASEADNGLKNLRGTIAMARSSDFAHSATSLFFFNISDNPDFDYVSRDTPENFGYCVFGEVVSGMEVLDAIGKSEVKDEPGFPSCPKTPVVIHSIEQTR